MNDAFDIEELLKAKLLNKSKVPPVELFQEIERRLIRRKRRRRFLWLLFWIGLGIGAYFIGAYFTSLLNTECDCLKTECDEVVKEKRIKLNPVSQDTLKATLLHIGNNKGDENDINSLDANPNKVSRTLSLENHKSKKSDSHTSSQSNSEVMEIDDFALSGIDSQKNVMVQLESEQKTMNSSLSEDENDSKSRTEATDPEVGRIKSSNPLFASTVEPPIASLLTIESPDIGLSEDDLSSNSQPAAMDLATGEIKKSNPPVASLEISPIELLPTNRSPEINSKGALVPHESITGISETKDKNQNYGLTTYAGPSFFDVAVFKPYLSSGSLSTRPFKSTGYELGIGGFKKLNERWQLNLSFAYNRKQSQFLYDLLVSEEDYFNYYDQGVLISVDELDQEENCNCFVANDIQLEYDINTINLSFGMSYQLVEVKKFNILGNFNLSTNLFSRFKNNSSSVVNFPSQKTEKLNSLGLLSGVAVGYTLTKNTRLTVSPNYMYLFTRNASSFYARSLHELTVSLGMTFLF